MRRLNWIVALVSLVVLLPAVALADDQEAADLIAKRLEESGQMKGYSVGIKVKDKTAWLAGKVASQEQMTTAITIAQKTGGVDRVVNNLAIVPPPSSRKLPGSLHQPSGVANAQGASSATIDSHQNGIVRAGVELPDHAQQELSLGGPTSMNDGEEMSGRLLAQPIGARNGRTPLAMQNSSAPMTRARQPMPLAMNTTNMGPYGPGAMSADPESVGAPRPLPMHVPSGPGAVAPYRYDNPQMPGYAWPSYAAYPNYAALTYPKQYSPTAWPYIGPFYPYPQVPLGWRKVTLEWDDGWWFLDFKDHH